MAGKNCWEFMNCSKTNPEVVKNGCNTCPALTNRATDGINGGKAGGRACWAIVGTLAREGARGYHAGKRKSCIDCEFYQSVQTEEGNRFLTGSDLAEFILDT